ncbi:MAG: hypothetical protein SVU32_05315 [Candidatus Nanohaloarchaea archaeon]|nr:hypothetical protein [Candidatus Nanohaloarchaea archaeon]
MSDAPEEDGDRREDPVAAIFRILDRYYEGVEKREDEGIGAE